jgi:hypothetical protein
VSRRQADLGITFAVAVLTCIAVVRGAPVAVTAPLGIALFAAPGYLLGQLFGPRVAGLERVAVSTGLAFCVPVIGGLLLYLARVPLHRAAWLGLAAGVTLACDVLLFSRRLFSRRRRGDQAVPLGGPPKGWQLRPWPAVAFGAAVVIAAGGLGLARVGAAMQHEPGFTQLWLAHQAASASTGDLGVSNDEGSTTRYRLVLLRNGHRVSTWNLTLANGQTWHRSPPLPAGGTVAADLYRLPDLSHPYRHVALGERTPSP